MQKATSPTALVTLDVQDKSSAAATTTAPGSSSSFLFYVASRFGDSQLVRLFLDRRSDADADADADAGAEAELQLVASYPSLAPILDCCLVEDEAGGSVRLSCSRSLSIIPIDALMRPPLRAESPRHLLGGLQDWFSPRRPARSRYFRDGRVGGTERAEVVEHSRRNRQWVSVDLCYRSAELLGLMSISVCVHACRNTSLLVLGSYAETRVLRISSSGNNATDLDGDADGDGDLDIEEVSILPFADPAAASATTIFAGAVGDHLLVQVRSDGVAYSSFRGDETAAVRHWKPTSGRKITAAGSSYTAQDGAPSSYLLIAVEGGELEVLRAQGGELVSNGCVSLPPNSRRLDCDKVTEGTKPSL